MRGPRLQNIPIRTEEGKRIREAFMPKERLFNLNYAEIEQRIMDAMKREQDEDKRRNR